MKNTQVFRTESFRRFSVKTFVYWEYLYNINGGKKKRTISPFLRTTIFRWCEKNFFSRRKGCGSFFIHLGRRWSYPIFNFKTNESSRNFCGGGSCYTWQWEFHHHTPRYGVVYTSSSTHCIMVQFYKPPMALEEFTGYLVPVVPQCCRWSEDSRPKEWRLTLCVIIIPE